MTGGRDAIVIAHADERAEHLVLRRDGLELGEGFKFAFGVGQLERPAQADVFRHGGGNQFVQIFKTEGREHFARFGGVWADVTADKLVGMRGQAGRFRQFMLFQRFTHRFSQNHAG